MNLESLASVVIELNRTRGTSVLSGRETSQIRRLRLLENRRSADVALFLLPGVRYNYQDTSPTMTLQHCAHIDLRLVLEAIEAAAG